MVMSDVMHDNIIFEDWYINEKYMPNDNWKKFIDSNVKMNNLNLKYYELFNNILENI
jgi:hypothetical protein